MKILLHICCAPCTVYPAESLSILGHQVRGFFYNPNIHPYQEFLRRSAALEDYAEQTGLPIIWDRSYHLEEFLRNVVFREQERCRFCYYLRLKATSTFAKGGRPAWRSQRRWASTGSNTAAASSVNGIVICIPPRGAGGDALVKR
jgi:predicted adenine nucleotide alpha hydrolase (AANH) superfamily ATPase